MTWCSISQRFETNRKEETFTQLKLYLNNAVIGMTQEKYIEMSNRLGDEIDFDRMPPDYNDFPTYVHLGIGIFNDLPDNYSGGMSAIYVGKDLASLPVLMGLYSIEDSDKIYVFEVIQFLDARARKQAIKAAEKASKKSSR